MTPLHSVAQDKVSRVPSTRGQSGLDTSSNPHNIHSLNTLCDQSETFSTDPQSLRQVAYHVTIDIPQASGAVSLQTSTALYAASEFEISHTEIEVPRPGIAHVSPHISYTKPQWVQARADEWAQREGLCSHYEAHKRLCVRGTDPVALQVVAGMELSWFVRPTTTSSSIPAGGHDHASGRQFLFQEGSPPDDLSHSLRNFITVDPVQDPNVVYGRVAVREGRTMAGYVAALPEPRRVIGGEGAGEAVVGPGLGRQ